MDTVELTEDQWAVERNEVARRFLGMGADEFVAAFEAGQFADDAPDGLMAVLMVFPELD